MDVSNITSINMSEGQDNKTKTMDSVDTYSPTHDKLMASHFHPNNPTRHIGILGDEPEHTF